MKQYKILFLIVSILISGICKVNAQQPVLRGADNLFRDCQYENALNEYKKGIKKLKSNRVEIQRATFQIAECYRIMGDLKKAEQQYLRLEKKNYQKDNPMILFHLGSIYNLRGDYDLALKYYNNYKKRVSDDPRVDVRIDGCNKAKMWNENPTRYEVENLKKFNTKEDDWAPRWANNEKRNAIMFSSNREGSAGKGTDQWTSGSFSDIYISTKPKSKNTDWPGEWSPVTSMDEGGMLNSGVNEGEASANRKGTVLYFTKCPQDKKKVQGCYIYKSMKKGKTWGEPEIVELGDSAYNYVHPFISDDELTIWFASNMPGGHGGYDLYTATRTKKTAKFTNITNLGPKINTEGQEVFPAWRNEEEFYFSSDGHPGLGGLDIFVSHYKNGEFGDPENLMVPINSCGDEIGIIFDENEAIDPQSKSPYLAKGYFSSSRQGGRGGDDIYYFLLRPIVFTLSGYVRDKNNGQYMDGVEVQLVGSDGTTITTTTDVKGYYHFDKAKILGSTTYDIAVSKKGYWERGNTAKQTTVGLTENTDLKQDFMLERIPKEPIVLPEILYDLAKWDLKPQYKDSLMFLYNIMIQNPTIVVELRSHTDVRGNDDDNDVLSQRRAQSCVDFLVLEKGIAADRIVPKGYGERVPRRLDKDMAVVYNGKTYHFSKGTYLTEDYINSLPSKPEQEAAHQLNRRTEFAILRDDYVPSNDSISKVPTSIAVVQERTVPVTIDGDKVTGTCYANSKSLQFQIGDNSEEIFMNYADATRFLKESFISLEDFEEKAAAIKQEDGSIIEGAVLYLEELRIGDDYSENVKVTVKKNLPAAIVVGDQYIREEWGEFTIDKSRNVILYR